MRDARLTSPSRLGQTADASCPGELRESAIQQDATRWMRIAELPGAYCGSATEFGSTIMSVRSIAPWNVTYLADLVCRRLDEFDQSVISEIGEVAKLHPGRWRFVLRDRVGSARLGEGLAAARLLEPIGDVSDIQRLRDYAKRQRKLPGAASLGRQLARNLADGSRSMIKIGS